MNPGSRSRFGPPQPNLAELKLLTDDQLMVQLQEGVNDALAVLFERYHRLVFSIALKIVRDRGEAEDVTQNVFLEIYSSVAQFDPVKGTLKVWLLQYAYHRAFNWKRRLNTRNFYNQEGIEDLDPLMYRGIFQRREIRAGGIAKVAATGASVTGPSSEAGDRVSELRRAFHEGDCKQDWRFSIERAAPLLSRAPETAFFIAQPRGPVKMLVDE